MQDINKGVSGFLKSIDELCNGIHELSEKIVTNLTKNTDEYIASDACRFREASNIITRKGAPHSSVAKLLRDLEYNIGNPLRTHIENNEKLNVLLQTRQTKLSELNKAKAAFEKVLKNEKINKQDKRFVQAADALDTARSAFRSADGEVFEWLHILEEYRLDIYDSCLQTLKYLQYEFFAASAHAVSHVLPVRMEFRPMIEMTPDQLEAQVNLELKEREDLEVEDDSRLSATDKILEKWEKFGAFSTTATEEVVADAMSVCALLSQGFEEGLARRALRRHNNDMQAAVDWILSGCPNETKISADAVRLPSTLKRMQRLRQKRRQLREQLQKERKEKSKTHSGKKKKERKDSRTVSMKSDDKHSDVGSSSCAESKQVQTLTHTHTQDSLIDLTEATGRVEPTGPAHVSNLEDLLGLNDEPPPPTTFGEQLNVTHTHTHTNTHTHTMYDLQACMPNFTANTHTHTQSNAQTHTHSQFNTQTHGTSANTHIHTHTHRNNH
eukprot:GHVR01009748.1.p1 GENE.GHVR01009748.1~~GHVR01009748.1.p1  ORF type:complete len:497 (+),score=172.56 GHVR01009748.1:269-1759(+)